MRQLPVDLLTPKELVLYVALPAAGAVIGHLWTRFRSRMATLRWTAQCEPMAFATQDFGWGKVEILYDNQAVGNLHIITVRITNESQIDLQTVELHFHLDDGTFVLRSMAQVVGALEALPFAPEYAAMLATAGQRELTAAEIAVWGRRSYFTVPVLNRGASIDVRFLVGRSDHITPTVALDCNHLGVRVRHEPPAEQFLGVSQTLAAWLGLAFGFGVVVIVVRAALATWSGATAAWLAGVLGVVVGAGVIWAWRGVRRLTG